MAQQLFFFRKRFDHVIFHAKSLIFAPRVVDETPTRKDRSLTADHLLVPSRTFSYVSMSHTIAVVRASFSRLKPLRFMRFFPSENLRPTRKSQGSYVSVSEMPRLNCEKCRVLVSHLYDHPSGCFVNITHTCFSIDANPSLLKKVFAVFCGAI